jgi:hypothetical protein
LPLHNKISPVILKLNKLGLNEDKSAWKLAAMHAAHNVFYLSQNFYYVHFEINDVSCNLIGCMGSAIGAKIASVVQPIVLECCPQPIIFNCMIQIANHEFLRKM